MLETIHNRGLLLTASDTEERSPSRGSGQGEPASGQGSGRGHPTPTVGDRRAAYRRGIVTFIALAVLTGLEFLVATMLGSLVLLFIAALLKAAIILQYFMHLGHVWEEQVEEVG